MQQIDHKERGVKGKYKRATNVNLSVDVGFYKDHYDYTMSTNGQGDVSEKHMKVFIPTTPNPTSGFIVFADGARRRQRRASPRDRQRFRPLPAFADSRLS